MQLHDHDHDLCLREALDRIQAVCHERGVKLTEVRRRILELIWTSHRAYGAYDLLDMLRAERGRVDPPTVYRALDFLLDQGFIHRVESLNAFIGCPLPDRSHSVQFFICDGCGTTLEAQDRGITQALERSAKAQGFQVEQKIVELRGRCAGCCTD
ncbi:MAG: transcriptional repressor [Pseudomonadota bacterium]|uniref:transcriptional repressor n=1 Tax=Fodinicurvata fenggangensis TaxID=1121830 RepID=UPI00047BCF20|nr:transcriptional repressor [Fodinicurvata fenggangensis]